MKNLKQLGLITVASMLIGTLSACGLVRSLIPDQDVTNPLGLDGKELELVHSSDASLVSQAVSDNYEGAFSTEFADQDIDIPSGLEPSTLEEMIGIAAMLEISSDTTSVDSFPNTTTLNAITLSFSVTDGSGTPTVEQSFSANEGLNVSYTRTDKPCNSPMNAGKANCAVYETSAAQVDLLKVSISGGNFDMLYGILTGGGSPNSVTGSIAVSFASDSGFPDDSSLIVTAKTSAGKILF